MSSEDYLIRYFRQLASVLGAILDYRKRKEYSLAIDEIDQTLNAWFGGGASSSPFDESQIDSMLQNPSENYEAEKSMAELLYQKAITYRDMGNAAGEQANALLALRILKDIDAKSGEYSVENQLRISELDQMVQTKA